ncbi:thiamine biosynthesis protein ApbE [Massilia sp. WF1]|uniref:FAD:protein FMN transferase n=1 Tax=unclassified Massilia TaxID=2609279 RepID=UPI0006495E64|nr:MULTISPECIES: FAD:protein FMN transferase [unclassified Massilia]ALK98232.1 thiamine biosynthesis protein ApbE [Massilia sp. WG5]KLU37192.1 thiamine biosynthesis protein ApbE [Massilia sp. WF1]
MRAVLVPLDADPVLPDPASRPHGLAGTSMGTGWSARLMLPPALASGPDGDLRGALQRELDGIVAQMSHWDPGSLLSRYNRAPGGSWHALPPQFFAVMDYALSVFDDSGGAYDPAAGALVNLWGFGPVGRYDQAGFYAPAAGAVAAVLAQAREGRPVLDREGRRLLQPGGAVLDLSSVAKGYAVDCLARRLEALGVGHYLVEVGGELRGAGVKGDGQPWWVELEGVPDAADAAGAAAAPAPQAVVALHGLAVATSGDYRRYFHHARRRASHTLDPRTGSPVDNGVASVTVLAPDCMAADALSTALTVMGAEAGLAFAEGRHLAARFLLREGGGLREVHSPAWRALLQ